MRVCTHSIDDPCDGRCFVTPPRPLSLDLTLWNYDIAVRREEKKAKRTPGGL